MQLILPRSSSAFILTSPNINRSLHRVRLQPHPWLPALSFLTYPTILVSSLSLNPNWLPHKNFLAARFRRDPLHIPSPGRTPRRALERTVLSVLEASLRTRCLKSRSRLPVLHSNPRFRRDLILIRTQPPGGTMSPTRIGSRMPRTRPP